VAKFEMCSNVSWTRSAVGPPSDTPSSLQVVAKNYREWTLVMQIASCLGTKRELCDQSKALPYCCNERDAARVCADLKLLELLRCDLQKNVFDGWRAKIGAGRKWRSFVYDCMEYGDG
jgi:hypothetical protein